MLRQIKILQICLKLILKINIRINYIIISKINSNEKSIATKYPLGSSYDRK